MIIIHCLISYLTTMFHGFETWPKFAKKRQKRTKILKFSQIWDIWGNFWQCFKIMNHYLHTWNPPSSQNWYFDKVSQIENNLHPFTGQKIVKKVYFFQIWDNFANLGHVSKPWNIVGIYEIKQHILVTIPTNFC